LDSNLSRNAFLKASSSLFEAGINTEIIAIPKENKKETPYLNCSKHNKQHLLPVINACYLS
jgi:hypothetical protein